MNGLYHPEAEEAFPGAIACYGNMAMAILTSTVYCVKGGGE